MSAFIKFIRLLSDSVFPLLFWVSLIFGFDTPDVAVLTIIAALIHEGGHLIMLGILGRKTPEVMPHPTGFRIESGGLGYIKDILVLSGGALINIAVFILTLPLGGLMGGYFRLIGSINLITALSNLMPIEGYDGYGILSNIISMSGHFSLLTKLEYISFFISAFMFFISIYLLMRYGEGYWLAGVFFTIMISKIAAFVKRGKFRE